MSGEVAAPRLSPVVRPRVLVVGAGARGSGYGEYVGMHPAEGVLVGVAERNPERRAYFATRHAIPPENVFETWEEALSRPAFADLVIIATQDAYHVEPAIKAAEAGYHILLEKPIAPTADECRRVVAAVEKAGVLFAVCHVLRYTPHTLRLQALLAEGAIGDVQSIEHHEPVGYWHAAHSYVRGAWRKESESSPMLLAKSCHDLDWLLAIAGRRCERVSSFGSTGHFTRAHQPEGAADRCLECPQRIESVCPYSAKKLYVGLAESGYTDWPLSVVTADTSVAGTMAALRDGPYGRCVYACDNDVVDHQVVQLEFAGGLTASFTMTAFTTMRARHTRLFGSHGEIHTDSQVITVDDFRTGDRRVIDMALEQDDYFGGGHWGGDAGLMRAVLAALRAGDASLVPSDASQSLQGHLMVFSAERARRHGTVEDVPLR